MNFREIAAVFVLAAVLMLGVVFLDEGWLAGSALGFTVSGTAVAVALLIRRYIYSGVLLGFHVSMSAFTTWVFLNRESVVRESEFVFSAFTDANLQWAIVTLVGASLVVFLPWVVLARGGKPGLRASARSLAYELMAEFDRLPVKWVQVVLAGSLVLVVWFFMTNTSVLDSSYPLQLRTHWIPGEFLKVPALMAVWALGFAYARRLNRGRGVSTLLLFARLNFMIVSTLTLVLMGSRGLITFFWVGVGVFEILLWNKRRGSLAWGVVFVVLAWFAYQSWPYMRQYLASLPAPEVLVNALRIGLGLGSDANLSYVGGAHIRLGDITMFSASLFQLLYVIQLIKDGISLDGYTFVNLIPNALPSWLDGVLWVRPLGDIELLREYYFHGGGFLVVANAYWNGGLWVALLFMAVVSASFVGFDRFVMRPNTGLLYRTVYWLWLPVAMTQLGYGIQGFMRVVELLGAVILLERFLRRRVQVRGSLLGKRVGSRSSPDRVTGDLSK